LNGDAIEAKRYVELREKDVLKFGKEGVGDERRGLPSWDGMLSNVTSCTLGLSSREYVLMTDTTAV